MEKRKFTCVYYIISIFIPKIIFTPIFKFRRVSIKLIKKKEFIKKNRIKRVSNCIPML